MSKVSYLFLPDGGFIATSPDRPDEYLEWHRWDPKVPGSESRNVVVCRRSLNWEPQLCGHKLDWHAFQVMAETLLGTTETTVERAPEAVHSFRYVGTVASCSCGHWRRSVAILRATAETAWQAHVMQVAAEVLAETTQRLIDRVEGAEESETEPGAA